MQLLDDCVYACRTEAADVITLPGSYHYYSICVSVLILWQEEKQPKHKYFPLIDREVICWIANIESVTRNINNVRVEMGCTERDPFPPLWLTSCLWHLSHEASMMRTMFEWVCSPTTLRDLSEEAKVQQRSTILLHVHRYQCICEFIKCSFMKEHAPALVSEGGGGEQGTPVDSGNAIFLMLQ